MEFKEQYKAVFSQVRLSEDLDLEVMQMKKHTVPRTRRLLVLAAALTLLIVLGATAYATDFFGFRALEMGRASIDDPMDAVISLTQPQDTPEEPASTAKDALEANEAAWAEWCAYKASLTDALRIPAAYENTPKGTAQMTTDKNADGSFTLTYYDENGAVLETSVISAEEHAAMLDFDRLMVEGGIPGYDFNYNVCTAEEAAKLEEIAAKYGLRLRGEVNLAWSSDTMGHTGEGYYTNVELADMTAGTMGNSGSIFTETPVGFDKVYWFDEGTFCISYYIELPSSGKRVTCYGYNSMYSTLSSGNEVITTAKTDGFSTREYISADGTALTILENGTEAFIYAFLEDSFFAEHIGSADMTTEDINYIADYLIYSNIGR